MVYPERVNGKSQTGDTIIPSLHLSLWEVCKISHCEFVVSNIYYFELFFELFLTFFSPKAQGNNISLLSILNNKELNSYWSGSLSFITCRVLSTP